MPRKVKSLEWKLKSVHPELRLGAYEINAVSKKKNSPEMVKFMLEKGALHQEALANPLRTFVEKRDKMRALFTPKERTKILTQAIKRNFLSNIKASELSPREEIVINRIMQTLEQISEDKLVSVLNNQRRLSHKEFADYLIENAPALIRASQAELDLKNRESTTASD